MAIKKTTTVKKSDPPSKKKQVGPPASPTRLRKVDSYVEDPKTGKRTYYESGREMLPYVKQGLTKEQKQGQFNQMLALGGTKNPLYDPASRYPMGLYGKGKVANKPAVKTAMKKTVTKKK
jgi:hypothetical protein